jgi:hypothetical protein
MLRYPQQGAMKVMAQSYTMVITSLQYIFPLFTHAKILYFPVYQQLQTHLVQLQRRGMKFKESSKLREAKGVRTGSDTFSRVHRITRQDTNVEGREKKFNFLR